MKRMIPTAIMFMTMAASAMAQEKIVYLHDTVFVEKPAAAEEVPVKNNWGARLKESNVQIGLDLQAKYVWRGMEMMTDEAAPVLFPSMNCQYKGLYVYAMGGYAINGKYAEVDLGASYTWKGMSIGFNDYYYPTVNGAEDEYFKGGKNTGHWLEACITYAPEKLPLWITVSSFFAGADKYVNDDGDSKNAYSTYLELGTYWEFLKSNRISAAVGMTPGRSCYNGYEQKFKVCNVDLKYTYNVGFKSGWTLPLSVEYIYNPVYDKSYVNFVANLAF